MGKFITLNNLIVLTIYNLFEKELIMQRLNDDQYRILDILKSPTTYVVRSEENGVKGLPYKEIMKASDLSVEKTLLSLGWLEANGYVTHECAVQRQMVDYLGRNSVELVGQKIVRMFYLTQKGKSLHQ